MSQEEILKILTDQLKTIRNKQEYLTKRKELALSSEAISELLQIQIRSTINNIKRLLKQEEITRIVSKEDKRKKYYIANYQK